MNMEQLTEFFGWMTVINIGLLTFSSIMVMILKKLICKMHGKMFGISEENIAAACYMYLGIFKIVAITLNLVPYIALRIMGC